MDAGPLKLTDLTALTSHLAPPSVLVPADLVVNGVITVRDSTRAELLEWVESYYVKRGGYEQVAINTYVLHEAGVDEEGSAKEIVVSTVRIVPHKIAPPAIAYPDA